MIRDIALIGYSGHSYVVCDIFHSNKQAVTAYAEKEMKGNNPYGLTYLGSEQEEAVLKKLAEYDYFVAIGDNNIRRKITEKLLSHLGDAVNAIHRSAIISATAQLRCGIMVAAGVTINAMASLGKGVICNTGSIIEHECAIGDYAHIAPGAVLCGNVHVGAGTFVGANSVVREGIRIGENVIIGAGTVVTRDIPANVKVVGNPYRII